MTKKRVFLLVLIIAVIIGCVKLFYKTYSRDVVAKSADCILVLDVKRITNTIIWNTITTPGQWKIGKLFSRSKKETSWKDMVKIPDYAMAFHVKDQPAGLWYIVLDIKSEKGFEEGLQHYNFFKTGTGEYVTANGDIRVLKNGHQLLIGNSATKNQAYFKQVANELFIQKKYVADEMIQKALAAKSHLALEISRNSFLEEDAVLTANFDKEKISIDAELVPKATYVPMETTFSYDPSALFSVGCSQPSPALYALWGDSAKATASKFCNLTVDSFFLKSNRAYQLAVQGFVTRMDSVITYTYDDDFNKVENVMVNKVNEPAFDLTVKGDSVEHIMDYFQRQNLLEETAAGKLFTPFPFAKSYTTLQDGGLHIRSAYKTVATPDTTTGIFFMNILTGKVTPDMWKFTPDAISKALANIESIKMKLTKDGKKVVFNCTVRKKKEAFSVINL